MSMNVDNVFDSISGYAVSGKATDNAYNTLSNAAAACFSAFDGDGPLAAADFADDCRKAEDEFMQINYASDAKARHVGGKKAGQWKYRSYLPQSYNSAKSALHKALEAGIDPTGLGKTALDKKRSEKTSTPRSAEERIERALTTIINAINELSMDDADEQRALIKERLAI